MTETRSLELAGATTALLVIDLQKGIVERPSEPHPPAAVVGNAARLAAALREKGGFVVLVTVSFGPTCATRCDRPATIPAGRGPRPRPRAGPSW